MLRYRLSLIAVAFLLVLTACGGDDDASSDTTAAVDTSAVATTTTTTEAPATTTTAAPETTTTAPPETTTTSAPEPAADADAMVEAKTDAAIGALPDDWTSSVELNEFDASDTDELFGACTEPGSFDISQLDTVSLAVANLDAEGPMDPTSFFPGPMASLEARVFESSGVADEAFDVLEQVIGTDAGRECMAERFVELLAEDALEGEFVYDLTIEEVVVAGADVGTRLIFDATIEGFNLQFYIDLVAALNDTCAVYATFFGFGEAIDPETRDAIFQAAAGV